MVSTLPTSRFACFPRGMGKGKTLLRALKFQPCLPQRFAKGNNCEAIKTSLYYQPFDYSLSNITTKLHATMGMALGLCQVRSRPGLSVGFHFLKVLLQLCCVHMILTQPGKAPFLQTVCRFPCRGCLDGNQGSSLQKTN